MTWLEVVRIVLEVVLGGGFIVTVATIKATKKKSRAEALQAEMELGKSYVAEFTQNIVEPLKTEVSELKKDINGLKRELARLRKAINKTNNCEWVDSCPVVRELQSSEREESLRGDNEQGELFGKD